jgi:hypothetical protein
MLRRNTLALALVLAPSAMGQGFNIDLGSPAVPFSIPAAPYGGAASQTGYWNVLEPFQPLEFPAPVDLSPTIAGIAAYGTGITADFTQDPATSGDDENLMDDGVLITGAASDLTIVLANVANGTYQVYVYAMSPSTADTSIVSVENASTGPQTCGGVWPGAHVQGVTYTKHSVHVSNGLIRIHVRPSVLLGYANGVQVVHEPDYEAYCFGTPAICPCGNGGAQDAGCANSVFTGGAILRLAAGGVSLAADTVVLQAQQVPPGAPALFFQGTSAVTAPFGDGVRCVGGTLVRLATKTAVSGVCSFPEAGDPPLSVKGQVAAPGERRYQAWYRNAASFCTSETFNMTNGMRVTWQP